MGLVASTLAKLVWRNDLKRIPWLHLSASATGCAALALIGGLVAFGHDGRITTYVAMVLAVALNLWWVGFRPHRR